jgi:hypothetical protein
MSAIVELLPLNMVSVTSFQQPTDSVVDVGNFIEASIILNVVALNRNSGTTKVMLQTAIENRDEQYADLTELASFAADPGSYPYVYHVYLAGPGAGAGSNRSGFGRYLRASVTQASGAVITLGIRAIVKP